MIIQATRIGRMGGVQFLAAHLLDKTDDNEAIEVLAGDRDALADAHALAQVKRCKFSVRHLSISPEGVMTPSQLAGFLRAIDAQFGIGPDRPRLIVRHVKKGRSHFHIAVAEVDPTTFRVLDSRNDYARLEELARRYEKDHAETMQPTRAERRAKKTEGLSDVARKRAERGAPGFDRTKLKAAFAAGFDAFRSELKAQNLRISNGEKGPILVAVDGAFVAAANRAVGVKRNEFVQFLEKVNAKLVGNHPPLPGYASDNGNQHGEAPATPLSVGNAGSTRSHRTADGTATPYPRHAATASRRIEVHHRKARSHTPAIVLRRLREDLFLRNLGKVSLDELLRRALAMGEWMASLFQSRRDGLAQQITAARKRESSPSADTAHVPAPSYYYRRRMTP